MYFQFKVVNFLHYPYSIVARIILLTFNNLQQYKFMDYFEKNFINRYDSYTSWKN